MTSNLVLANPTSGRGKGAKVLAQTLERLERDRIQFTVIAASSLKDSLHELAQKDLTQYQRLLVIGGDGMVHHVINALGNHPKERQLPIGIIPAGTGNDFARALGLDIRNPVRNLDQFFSSDPNRVDLGEVNGTRFGAICSTGFDSMVNERANGMSWPKGKRKYDIAMLQELPRFKPRRYSITVDGEKFEVSAMLIAVANGSSYGGGMKVCPDAKLTDGLLDVMILHPVPKFEFLRIFPKVYSGAHIHHEQVQIVRGANISIIGEAITYADGERISPTPVTVKVLKGALQTWINNGR